MDAKVIEEAKRLYLEAFQRCDDLRPTYTALLNAPVVTGKEP